MRTLAEITSIEEQNGITEALYLLEERLDKGCDDLLTVLRTLFLYWFMVKEPAYFTNDNGSRNWVENFGALYAKFESRFRLNCDFIWVCGYLFSTFSGQEGFMEKGESLIKDAAALDPENPFPNEVRAALNGLSNYSPGVNDSRFDDWGMMGEYFKYIFTKN